MKVRLNTELQYLDYKAGAVAVQPLAYNSKVAVGFDQSKRGWGVSVIAADHSILAILEFGANGDSTTELCRNVRAYLTEFFASVIVEGVCIEEPITPSGHKLNYNTTLVLMEIFFAAKEIAASLTGDEDKVHLYNNWSWKSGILPAGYRQKGTKGSLPFLEKEKGIRGLTDNESDAICLAWYGLKKKHIDMLDVYPLSAEIATYSYKAKLAGAARAWKGDTFLYNYELSLKRNIAYIVNRYGTPHACVIDPSRLTLVDVYDHKLDIDLKQGEPRDRLLLIVGRG